MSLWKTLGLDRLAGPGSGAASGDRAATETVRRIVAELNRLEPERARFIAAFAYILSRVAHADLEISDVETLAMERAVRDLGGLREEEAVLVVQMAKTQALLFGSTENFLVTREFARVATPEQKRNLLECLFAVSAADETITGVEEAEIRRIVSELDLGHGDFIAARSRFLQYVAVLKEREPPAS
ncbi:MAG TPA: TerB family tellurite resistance protein [Candidatus Eisenbacteria bacterium]